VSKTDVDQTTYKVDKEIRTKDDNTVDNFYIIHLYDKSWQSS
ncbi:24768_t:CDS:1, partial [Racocetra persica]